MSIVSSPVGCGSGRKTITDEMGALVHSDRHLTTSWKQATDYTNSFFTLVGDLGEAGVDGYCNYTTQLVGPWVVQSDGHGVESYFDFGDEDDIRHDPDPDARNGDDDLRIPGGVLPAEYDVSAPSAYELNFKRSVFWSGPHHVVHNFAKGLPKVMGATWIWYLRLLKHFCRMLSNPWSCQRVIETCFESTAFSSFIPDLNGFHHLVYDERWGTAMAANAGVVGVYHKVKLGWNRERYLRGGGHADAADAGDDDKSKQANLDVAHEAFTSSEWFGTVHMMDILSFLILVLSGWNDDCYCHGRDLTADDICSRRRRDRYWKDVKELKCIMCACRAPNMANNEIREFVDRVFSQGQIALTRTLALEQIGIHF